MEAPTVALLALALVGLCLSFGFSGTETGLYTLNRVRLTVRAGRREPAALFLNDLLANPPRMLAVILVGNNIANYLASYGVAAILDRAGFGPVQTIAINAAVIIPIVFTFGEILPKDLFRAHTDHWTYSSWRFLQIAGAILTWSGLVPVVQGFGRLTARLLHGEAAGAVSARQQVSQLIKEGMGAGVLSEAQSGLADRALAMRERRVRDEMVPWSRVVTIPRRASRAEVEAVLERHNFTRFPVVDASGDVVGVLSAIDVLLDPDAPVASLMGPRLTVSAEMPVMRALRVMRNKRALLAIVIDGASRPLGIITIKDVVEPLTGELPAW